MLQNLLPNLVPAFLIAMPVPDVSSEPISCSGLSGLSTAPLVYFHQDYCRCSITSSVRLLPAFDYFRCSIIVSVCLLPLFVYCRRASTAQLSGITYEKNSMHWNDEMILKKNKKKYTQPPIDHLHLPNSLLSALGPRASLSSPFPPTPPSPPTPPLPSSHLRQPEHSG